MNQRNAADLSVIIVTPDRYESIRKTIGYLHAQTARDRLEIVIVAPDVGGLGMVPSDLADFFGSQVVPVGAVTSTAAARAAGISVARAPVVVLAEDHSYPETGWAEALIEAHRSPWAAVGPAVANANPESKIGWANLLMEYAPWVEASEARVMDYLPGHNSSYKRALLLDYGSDLEMLLEAESVLQLDLRARGYQLYLESAAKTHHRNVTRPGSTIDLRFHAGRLFAAARAEGWTPWRRLLYVGGAPLIPLVRLSRILGQIGRSNRLRRLLPGVIPALVLALAVDGVGQVFGYALGFGDATEQATKHEFHRERHLA